MHPPGLCNNLVLMSTSRTFEPRKLDFSCTCRMTPFDSSTTSYPPRSTSLFSTSISRAPFRHMKVSSWPRKTWPSACSRRLESDECAEASNLAGLDSVFSVDWAMVADPIIRLSPMRFPWRRSPGPKDATPASFGSAVNIILFWDNPMMGSAYPADDISHPRYRQIRPFSRPSRFLRAYGWSAQGRRADPAGPGPSPEKPAVVCCQIRGWRAPARCRGVHHDRPRFRGGPAQVNDDPSERRQGQIHSRQAGRQARRLTSIEIPQTNRPTIAMNPGEF